MKILVISDTHGNAGLLKQVIEAEGKPDLLLHLGDMLFEEEKIRAIAGCELQAVRGNCDFSFDWPIETVTEIASHLVFMTHGHYYEVNYGTEELEEAAREAGADIVIYGHTHIPCYEIREDGLIVLNPGSLGRSRTYDGNQYYAVMEIDNLTGKVTITHKTL